jgi:hypothetical protein
MNRGLGYWLKVLGVIPLLGMAGVLLLFAVGESAGGDTSGLVHAGPALAALGLIWLGWRFPATGGWVSLALGVLAFLRYGLLPGQPLGSAALIMAAPPVIGGLFFLASAWWERRKITG